MKMQIVGAVALLSLIELVGPAFAQVASGWGGATITGALPTGANTIGNVGVNGNSGTPSQTAVSVGITSTTVLAAAGATSFVKLCLAQSAANGIWVNWAGAAAVAAAPAEFMSPGQCDTWVKSTGYLPTSQINAIASSAVSVTLIHD